MAELPTGTVTFLFTDIEGSSTRWEQHFQAMRAAQQRHDLILRQIIDAHGGVVFERPGDAFCAAFASPPEALTAALVAQRALQTEPWGARSRLSWLRPIKKSLSLLVKPRRA